MKLKDTILTQFCAQEGQNEATPAQVQAILYPMRPDTSEIILGCPLRDYSASSVARAVEDCNATLLNLNILATGNDDGRIVAALRINHRNPVAAVRSLERYGFDVLMASDARDSDEEIADPLAETTRERVNEVLRYLSI